MTKEFTVAIKVSSPNYRLVGITEVDGQTLAIQLPFDGNEALIGKDVRVTLEVAPE